jgi:tRNA modification GTPase
MNALTRRETAIVSAIAGTTRDIVEARLDLGGYPILLADTAGLREVEAAGDPIEAEGVRRALARAEQADLKLVVFDIRRGLDDAASRLGDRDAIVVANKADLVPSGAAMEPSDGTLVVSAATGVGIDALRARLLQEAEQRMAPTAAPAITRARHRVALRDCVDHLARAEIAVAPELAAEDIRLAARALGRITGRIDVEDLLDVIFRDFCIGK